MARLRGWDNNLHHAIATATHRKLSSICSSRSKSCADRWFWGQRRGTRKPPQGYRSFAERVAIVAAILSRDVEDAAAAMRRHLNSVHCRMLPMLRRLIGVEGRKVTRP